MKYIIFFLLSVNAFAGQKILGTLEVTGETTLSGETASSAVYLDGSKKLKASSTVDSTELGYLDGVSSAIQTQLNGKEASFSLLPLSKGGTNKSITASAGQIIFTDADSFEALSAGTSGQLLQSNGTAAPSWSTFSILNVLRVPGQTSPKKYSVRFAGATSTTACSASPCTKYNESDATFGATLTRSATGIYSFSTAAIWAANSKITCVPSFIACEGFINTDTVSNGSGVLTGVGVITRNSGGSDINGIVDITCWGDTP